MTKFKKGDKVKLKDNIKYTYGIPYIDIKCCKGRIFTISEIYENCVCVLLEDKNGYGWHKDMLEPVKEVKENVKV